MKDVNAEFTRIAAPASQILSKRYRIDNTELVKTTSAQLTKGKAEVLTVNSLKEFTATLTALKPNQALTFGRPEKDNVNIITKDEWTKLGKPDEPIPRTNETFFYHQSGGIMMLDYDPQELKKALPRDELISILRDVFPGLRRQHCSGGPQAPAIFLMATQTLPA